MPVPTTFGVLAQSSGGGYTKPNMIRTGGTGTITSNAAGYLLTGFADNTFAYLDAGKASGKWYWEATAGNFSLQGVTDTPATNRTFGGYSTANAGLYELGPQTWNQYGSSPGWTGPAVSSGTILGFAVDLGAKTLMIYAANTLGCTISISSIGTTYPLFAFQSGPTVQVLLGAGNTTYSPPVGYSYI